jgi:hypothetical protein
MPHFQLFNHLPLMTWCIMRNKFWSTVRLVCMIIISLSFNGILRDMMNLYSETKKKREKSSNQKKRHLPDWPRHGSDWMTLPSQVPCVQVWNHRNNLSSIFDNSLLPRRVAVSWHHSMTRFPCLLVNACALDLHRTLAWRPITVAGILQSNRSCTPFRTTSWPRWTCRVLRFRSDWVCCDCGWQSTNAICRIWTYWPPCMYSPFRCVQTCRMPCFCFHFICKYFQY